MAPRALTGPVAPMRGRRPQRKITVGRDRSKRTKAPSGVRTETKRSRTIHGEAGAKQLRRHKKTVGMLRRKKTVGMLRRKTMPGRSGTTKQVAPPLGIINLGELRLSLRTACG